MIEKTIIGHLKSTQALPVYAEKPVEPPETYILVEKTGGTEKNHIRSATVAVQTVCRGSLLRACQLSEEHRELMLDLVKEKNVFHCSVNSGPYNFTDPETKEYRYQTVYNIFYK